MRIVSRFLEASFIIHHHIRSHHSHPCSGLPGSESWTAKAECVRRLKSPKRSDVQHSRHASVVSSTHPWACGAVKPDESSTRLVFTDPSLNISQWHRATHSSFRSTEADATSTISCQFLSHLSLDHLPAAAACKSIIHPTLTHRRHLSRLNDSPAGVVREVCGPAIARHGLVTAYGPQSEKEGTDDDSTRTALLTITRRLGTCETRQLAF